MSTTFSQHAAHVSVHELAQAIQATVQGSTDVLISGISQLDSAIGSDLSFVLKPTFHAAAQRSQAAAFVVGQPIPDETRPQLIVGHPLLAIATLAQRFFAPPLPPRGIHPSAILGVEGRIGPEASIGALVTIGDRIQIGARVTIHAGVHIGNDVILGDDCILYPRVSLLDRCVLGNRVILHSGTVIGSDGFGYTQLDSRHHKIPQLGNVVLEDDVELGANVTVDRGTFGSTRIKRGTKVDNQVQVAHNVVIGEDCILVAQVGIAGSTTLGNNVMIGGQAGLVDHITIGDNVRIAAGSGVTNDVTPGFIVGGRPAVDHATWRKSQVIQYQLPELRKEILSLRKRLTLLESRLNEANDSP